ncbi:sugar ABC transporter substrate-binding protein [Phytoactinopolyspora halotolerans]|uniref:Sugar ABC transporter substrate-binding protein n=1 Tax=Phytoactinopolyspora halotolerans TaxID=1981512 RepID=A0A6L9S906_9ACTN|nr:sugar ABC transporter substrate-binding protein [Phytoactinopolyspora halotolerans]NEE01549.1 sugar ABC transporter substrate-binding protein [Phytoactinopolyspora halotolerans]
MSRSARTVAAACTLPALTFAACGSDGGDELSAEDEQTLTVWAMGEEGKRLQDVADEFNQEYPSIQIDVTPVGWDQAHQKLVAAAAGGELPDMAQMGSTMMGEFIELGVLEPVDTSTFDQDDFFPAAWENNVVDGEVYGVPWYVDTRVLYYRTDLADEAGATHPPATWEELKELAIAYQENGSRFGISLPAGGEGAWQSLLPFLYSAGGTLVDDEGDPAFDSPEATKALEEYASYFSEGLTSTSVQPGQTVEQDFGSGDAPMFISGPWMVNNISEALPELEGKWAAVPLPADDAGSVSWVGGASLVTFTESRHKAAAQEFISFLTSPEKQADWYEISKSLPANMAAWEEEPLAGDPQLHVFEEQLATAGDVPAMPQWNEFAHEVDVAIERMANGGADAAQTAGELQAATEPLAE